MSPATPLPKLTFPGIDDPLRQGDNLRVLLRWAQTLAPRRLGTDAGTPLGGGAVPPSATDLFVQFGIQQVSFNGSGVGTITLPFPFPTNTWFCLLTSDNAGYSVAAAPGIATASVVPVTATATVGLGYLPMGRMYANAQTVLSSGVTAQITSMTSDFTTGGVTFGSNALTVPVFGVYQVSWQIAWQNAGGTVPAGQYSAFLERNGSIVRQNIQVTNSAGNPAPGDSDLISLNPSDLITLWGLQTSGSNQASDGHLYSTWVSVAMVGGTATPFPVSLNVAYWAVGW